MVLWCRPRLSRHAAEPVPIITSSYEQTACHFRCCRGAVVALSSRRLLVKGGVGLMVTRAGYRQVVL